MDQISKIKRELNNLTSTLIENDNAKLISFIWAADKYSSEIDYSKLTDKFNRLLIFRKPSGNFSAIAIDSVKEFENNEAIYFSSFSDHLHKLKSTSINNFNKYNLSALPLIFIASKFDFERNSDQWKNFSPITFFIPRIVLFQKDHIIYFVYNFMYKENSDFSDPVTEMLNFQNIIFDSSSNIDTSLMNSVKQIINGTGNEKSDWEDLINKSKLNLTNGHIEKLVISRSKSFELNDAPDWNKIIKKLTIQYSDCYLFLFKKKKSIFFGASPEKFLSSKDNVVEIEAVAGSAPRGSALQQDKDWENSLLGSSKIFKEHTFVSNFISNILNEFSDNKYFSEIPEVRKLDNIQHLVTKFTVNINDTDTLFSLMDKLFPTPAVCGYPKENTIKIIRKLEKHDRGLYSGLIGWMDLNGDCDFTVTIRSALAEDKTLTAFAGAGIVEESDPEEEFFETELKLKPILSLFQNDEKS
jgi:menaquinone-specific isochorismate synthase